MILAGPIRFSIGCLESEPREQLPDFVAAWTDNIDSLHVLQEGQKPMGKDGGREGGESEKEKREEKKGQKKEEERWQMNK